MIKKTLLISALYCAFLTASHAQESSFASAPATSKNATARLLASTPQTGGGYLAGIEIALQPKAITYWRQPGDAGVPPRFNFERSENVASVEPLYPAPKHLDDAGSLVAGYDATVIFPLRVVARDVEKPVTLNLDLEYAACKDICLPVRARLNLSLPQSGESPYAATLKAALARVPRKLAAAESATVFKLVRTSEAGWRLDYLGPGKAQELFAEAPEPFYLDVGGSSSDAGFQLKLTTSGATPPKEGWPATLTVITDRGAVEGQLEIK